MFFWAKLTSGRITYQLMEYWPPIVKNPTGNRAIDELQLPGVSPKGHAPYFILSGH